MILLIINLEIQELPRKTQGMTLLILEPWRGFWPQLIHEKWMTMTTSMKTHGDDWGSLILGKPPSVANGNL
jgi:hypothetical protein